MNRQEESPTGGGRGAGEIEAEGSSAIGDGGQAAVILMPDVNGMQVHILKVYNLRVHMQELNEK